MLRDSVHNTCTQTHDRPINESAHASSMRRIPGTQAADSTRSDKLVTFSREVQPVSHILVQPAFPLRSIIDGCPAIHNRHAKLCSNLFDRFCELTCHLDVAIRHSRWIAREKVGSAHGCVDGRWSNEQETCFWLVIRGGWGPHEIDDRVKILFEPVKRDLTNEVDAGSVHQCEHFISRRRWLRTRERGPRLYSRLEEKVANTRRWLRTRLSEAPSLGVRLFSWAAIASRSEWPTRLGCSVPSSAPRPEFRDHRTQKPHCCSLQGSRVSDSLPNTSAA